MTVDIISAIIGVQDLVGAVSGIKSAPYYPPAKLGPFPQSVCYPDEGIWEGGAPAGEMRGLITLTLDLFTSARQDLPYDVENSIAYGVTVPAALWADVTLGGVAARIGAVKFSYGVLPYMGVSSWFGWRFSIQGIKLRVTL